MEKWQEAVDRNLMAGICNSYVEVLRHTNNYEQAANYVLLLIAEAIAMLKDQGGTLSMQEIGYHVAATTNDMKIDSGKFNNVVRFPK